MLKRVSAVFIKVAHKYFTLFEMVLSFCILDDVNFKSVMIMFGWMLKNIKLQHFLPITKY